MGKLSSIIIIIALVIAGCSSTPEIEWGMKPEQVKEIERSKHKHEAVEEELGFSIGEGKMTLGGLKGLSLFYEEERTMYGQSVQTKYTFLETSNKRSLHAVFELEKPELSEEEVAFYHELPERFEYEGRVLTRVTYFFAEDITQTALDKVLRQLKEELGEPLKEHEKAVHWLKDDTQITFSGKGLHHQATYSALVEYIKK